MLDFIFFIFLKEKKKETVGFVLCFMLKRQRSGFFPHNLVTIFQILNCTHGPTLKGWSEWNYYSGSRVHRERFCL